MKPTWANGFDCSKPRPFRKDIIAKNNLKQAYEKDNLISVFL